MLRKLYIQNYAIIDEIEIAFAKSLNIITGETGAGKSILMGALSLILGERADTSVLQRQDRKCIIEGSFAIEDRDEIKNFLRQLDAETDDELLLRREIAANGKSRAFINDTPVNLQQLKSLASMLVDLHQQFDTLELGDNLFQMQVVDALSGNAAPLAVYKKLFQQWQQLKHELEELQQQKNNFNKEFDYNQYLFTELADAALHPHELEDMEAELKMLSHAESIKTALAKIYFELSESENPVVQNIKQLSNQLHSLSSYHAALQSLAERLQSAQIELQDISSEIENINDSVVYDEKRIDAINERMNTGYKLLKKHGVQTTDELLQIQNQLQQKLQAVLNMDETIAGKEKETAALLQQATAAAEKISAARKKQAAPFEEKVNQLLVQVGMPNAKIKCSITSAALNENGCDAVSFLFDANNSNRFEPLNKVASGGELSRLMLCIKSLVAKSMNLPTMIFDEIDTGISGEAAKQAGIILKQISAERQVVCITHQPQIAGRADAHFFVFKEIKDNAVKTNIRLLTKEERITAIAQMLSGEKPTAAALQNAREMVMN